MKTVIGLYDNMAEARDVVRDLVDAGFDRNDISLVAADQDERYARALRDRDVDMDTDTGDNAGEGAVAGALTGGAIGGLGGVLVGLGALAIPGIGPVLAAGPIVAGLTGAAIGAVAGGLIGALIGWGVPEEEAGYYAEGVRRGGTLVAVRVAEARVDRVSAIMNQHNPVDIEQRAATWRRTGWKGFDTEAKPYTAKEMEADKTIPVVKEELKVGKRATESGVRVHTHVVEEPVSEQVRLRQETVDVERRPVDRPLRAGEDAFQEKTIEMTEMTEEAVAEKRARVIEEIVLDKDVDYKTETVKDTVRRTEVDIDRIGDFDKYNDRFRRHYDTNFAKTGYRYNQYQPAYRYGYMLGADARYRDRNWADIEPDVRSRWEETNQGTWEEFKDAVREGWREVKSAV